jgi:hypothetical protein
MGLAASLESDARRINVKHIVRQYNPTFTAAVYAVLIVLCFAVERHAGHVLGSLAPRIALCLMVMAGLFRLIGGHVSRHGPDEQAKAIKSQIVDAVSELVSTAFRSPFLCLLCVSVVAELSKAVSLTNIALPFFCGLWFAPKLKRKWLR